MAHNSATLQRIRSLVTLVVDEVSMLHGRFVLLLDLLLRKARDVLDLPFGGVQMILVGDFLQIPPVVARDDPWKQLLAFEVFHMIGFFPRRFDLLQVFRQSDPEFLGAMREARNGRVGVRSLAYLRGCNRTVFPDDGIKPTIVFQTNRSVDAENERCMAEAPDRGDMRRVLFRAHALFADARFDPQLRVTTYSPVSLPGLGAQAERRICEQLDGMTPDMQVRTGMQVLFRFNVDPAGAQVANGTCGLVVGWTQVSADPSGGVGIATLVRIESQHVHPPTVLRDPHGFPEGASAVVVPVVKIGRTGQFFAVYPHTMPLVWDPMVRAVRAREQAEQAPEGASLAPDTRSYLTLLVRRLPFVAGWALTSHRVQGLTLDRVDLRIELSTGRQPPPASYYVTVSRVRSRDGLKITGNLEAKHFWTSHLALRYFGDGAAKLTLGLIWSGPVLAADHIAHAEYAKWKIEMETLPKPRGGKELLAASVSLHYTPDGSGGWVAVQLAPPPPARAPVASVGSGAVGQKRIQPKTPAGTARPRKKSYIKLSY
jgi:hypothetical protein